MDAEDDEKIPMSNRELRENVLTLLFAAHDATGAALTWTLKNLRENASLLDELTV
jgi:cytochrome P450